MPLLLTIMLFAAFGGIASAAFAVVFLWVREEYSALILPHFVSFATGALLGAALLALLPEAIAGAGPAGAHAIGLALIAGLASTWSRSPSRSRSCLGGAGAGGRQPP